MIDETTMDEVIRRATTAGLLRTNHVESKKLIEHLLDSGFKYTGPSLEQAPQRKKARAIDASGNPIWDAR